MDYLEEINNDLVDYSRFYPRLKDEYVSPIEDERKPPITKETVIAEVEAGNWTLGEGRGPGVCVRVQNGRILYGSPPPAAMDNYSYADAVTEIRSKLMSTVMQGNFYDVWFQHLMKQVQKGDARALVVFRDTFLGRPTEVSALATVNANKVQMMFTNALLPRPD